MAPKGPITYLHTPLHLPAFLHLSRPLVLPLRQIASWPFEALCFVVSAPLPAVNLVCSLLMSAAHTHSSCCVCVCVSVAAVVVCQEANTLRFYLNVFCIPCKHSRSGCHMAAKTIRKNCKLQFLVGFFRSI